MNELPGVGIQDRSGRWKVIEDDWEISGLGTSWIWTSVGVRLHTPPHTHTYFLDAAAKAGSVASLLFTDDRPDGLLGQSVHFCFDRIPSRWNPPGWVGIGKERPPNTNFLNSRIILEESLCSALGLFSVTPLSWNPRKAKVKDKRHYFFKHTPLISQSHALYPCCPFKVKCLLTAKLHVSKRQLPEARLPYYGSLRLRQLIALTLSQYHSTIFMFIW